MQKKKKKNMKANVKVKDGIQNPCIKDKIPRHERLHG